MDIYYKFDQLLGLTPWDGVNIIELPDEPHLTRTLENWVLGLMVRGKMGLVLGQTQWVVQAGDFYFLPAHQSHWGTEQNSKRLVIYFHFHAQARQCSSAEKGAVPLFGTLPKFADYEALFHSLQRAVDLGWVEREEWNRQLAAIIGQIAISAHEAKAASSAERTGQEILAYLRRHAERPLNRSHLSATLGYSKDHLERIFRTVYGTTLHQKHAEFRFERAAIYLREGLSPKEVASRLGFPDYGYFMKAFKRARFATPTQFQKSSCSDELKIADVIKSNDKPSK